MKGSLRKAAKKFNCSHETIRVILQKMKKPILCYKEKQCRIEPPFSDLWLVQNVNGYYKLRNSYFILDNESFFTLINSTLSGNDTYYSNDRTLTPDDVKHYEKSKYEPKVFVWLAISTKGVSQIHIRPSGMPINQEVYLNECIIKRLVPFINKNYSDGNYVFRPALASTLILFGHRLA
jgi:hypothetical protein